MIHLSHIFKGKNVSEFTQREVELYKRTFDLDDGDVLTAKQVKELQKRNAQLEEENLILKKAIAIFTPHSNND